jgi:hypothetical protein
MFAGAAGAVVAGGAAALYSQREKISAGWQWASDHLLFVGELFKPEYLRKRIDNVEAACRERGGGCANLYTNLGKGAREGYGITETVAGTERTFCNLPVRAINDGKEPRDTTTTEDGRSGSFQWTKVVNDKASDETDAHVTMFLPRDNPGFYALGELAKDRVTSWIDQGWYQTSNGPSFLGKSHGVNYGEVGDGWEKPDYDTEEIRAKERERDRYGNYPHHDVDIEGNLGKDWDSLDAQHGHHDGGYASDDDNDVRMREDGEAEDLENSVIVDRASKGEVPLPKSRGDTGI